MSATRTMTLLVASLLAHDAAASVSAERYDLTLTPKASTGSFSGRERVDLVLDERSSEVRLNSEGLTIDEVTAFSGTRRIPVTHHEAGGSVVIHLARPVGPGRLAIELAWSGELSRDLHGIYATQTDDRAYVFTQLEPRAARRVFPCLDGPEQRASFRIQAVVDADDQVISNGTIEFERVDPKDGRKTVTFEPTPPIPAYLVALAVGRFDFVDARVGPTTIRIATAEGQAARARLALALIGELLPEFERYLGVPFPFAKLDVVAVPELEPYAMENAGAIFVRSDQLLLDEDQTSPAARLLLMRRLAHELAHHWFGDLVTMATWKDLWLSESLARWAEFEMIDRLRPALGMWTEFHALRDSVLARDLEPGAHAVRVHGNRSSGAPAFDAITYNKGAVTLRMIERWIGVEAFRAALHDYLQSHAYGSATGEDLWRALGAHSTAGVQPLAKSWFESRGHPTLELDVDCNRGALEVHISQDPPLGDPHAGTIRPWTIPIILRTATSTLHLLVRHPRMAFRLREPGGCAASVQPDAPEESPYELRYGKADGLGGGAKTALPRIAGRGERGPTRRLPMPAN